MSACNHPRTYCGDCLDCGKRDCFGIFKTARPHLTVAQMLDRLHAAGVAITINERSTA